MAQDINIGVNIDSKGMGQLEKRTSQAASAMDNLNQGKNTYNRLEKGSAQLSSNSTKNFSKMNQVVGDGLVPAYAVLAANVFAVSAAFNVLRRSAQMEQLEQGIIAVGRASGQNLTMLSERLQEVSGNALSAAQSMEAVALGASSGFNSAQLEDLTKVAKGASLALGRNLPDSIDRLVRGAAKLEPEILDELGIMVRLDTAASEYAVAIGKTAKELTQFEKRQAFVNAIIEQGTSKFGALADEMDSNVYDSLGAAFQDLSHAVLSAVNTITPALRFLSDNFLMMVGSTAAFSAGIIGQMIPSLTEGGAELAKLAQAQSDQAKAHLKSLQGIEGAPKIFNQYVDGMIDGTNSAVENKKAINSLNASIRQHNTHLEKQPQKYAAGTKAGADKRAIIGNLELALGSYAAAQTAATVAEELNTIATYQNAAAQGNLQGMLTAGKAIWAADTAATMANAAGKGFLAKSIIIVNGTLATTITLLKGFAIYLLKMLPLIGLVTIAAGTLYMAFKKLRDVSMTDLDKTIERVQERLEEFPNILDKTVERIIRAKTEWDAFGAGLKSAAGITTQLATSFTEISVANAKERAKQKEDLRVKIALKKIEADRAQTQYGFTSDDKTSEFAGIGQEEASAAKEALNKLNKELEELELRQKLASNNGSEFAQQQSALVQTIGAGLTHFNALKEVTKDNANLQKLYGDTTEKLAELFDRIRTADTPEALAQIQKELLGLERATNNASEAFDNLVKAQDGLKAYLQDTQKDYGFLSELDDKMGPILKTIEGLSDFELDSNKVKELSQLLNIDPNNFNEAFTNLYNRILKVREGAKQLQTDLAATARQNAIYSSMGTRDSVSIQNDLSMIPESIKQLESEREIYTQLKNQEEVNKRTLQIEQLKTKEIQLQAKLLADNVARDKEIFGGGVAGVTDLVGRFDSEAEQDKFKVMSTVEQLQILKDASATSLAELAKLGPEGEMMASITSATMNMAEGFTTAFQAMEDGVSGFQGSMMIAAAAVQGLSQIQQAQAKNQVAGIDKAIEAEKKRDGQSAASLAKIAAMEKKKEAIQRKAFEQKKKMDLAGAIISTALGITRALAEGGPFAGPILATMIGAMGAMQIAAIQAQTFDGGGGSTPTVSGVKIGNRQNTTDLATARSPSGELAYARGGQGVGNMTNFTPAFTGYRASGGNTAFMVGEQGPEMFIPERPGKIVPADETAQMGAPVNVNFSINAIDATGVEDLLYAQRGNIIGMIRTAANSHGETFLETVDDTAMSMER